MSTFRNPVGPQSSKVYWRRRLVVLLGLIAVIIVVILLVVRPGADAASAAGDEGGEAKKAASGETPVPVPPVEEPVEGAACDPATVDVEAITDKANYAAEELPQLSFSITNTSETACTFNVGTTQQVFAVTSGEDLYWSSKDCETDPIDQPLLLEPNVATASEPIPWDRTRSSATTCDDERPVVPGGGATFSLNVTVGEVAATAPRSFLLN